MVGVGKSSNVIQSVQCEWLVWEVVYIDYVEVGWSLGCLHIDVVQFKTSHCEQWCVLEASVALGPTKSGFFDTTRNLRLERGDVRLIPWRGYVQLIAAHVACNQCNFSLGHTQCLVSEWLNCVLRCDRSWSSSAVTEHSPGPGGPRQHVTNGCKISCLILNHVMTLYIHQIHK